MKGHIRKRSAGSWEVRYDFGTDPATGKRRVATVTVRGDRKAAEKELRRLLRTVDDGSHVDPSHLTVRQWLQTWLQTVQSETSAKTFERYGEICRNFLMPAFGNIELAKLAPTQIQAAYNAWAVGGRRDGKGGGLSPQTRRHFHRVLRTASLERSSNSSIPPTCSKSGCQRLSAASSSPCRLINPRGSSRP